VSHGDDNGRPGGGGRNVEQLAGDADSRSLALLADIPASMRRRRSASRRLTALHDGHHDPHHQPDDEDLSPGALTAWDMAIGHLLGVGLVPIVPLVVRQARRGAA